MSKVNNNFKSYIRTRLLRKFRSHYPKMFDSMDDILQGHSLENIKKNAATKESHPTFGSYVENTKTEEGDVVESVNKEKFKSLIDLYFPANIKDIDSKNSKQARFFLGTLFAFYITSTRCKKGLDVYGYVGLHQPIAILVDLIFKDYTNCGYKELPIYKGDKNTGEKAWDVLSAWDLVKGFLTFDPKNMGESYRFG